MGKTCLTSRFADDEFHFDTLSTIGLDFKKKNIDIHGKVVRVECWDTAGQERYRSMSKAYFRGADAIIFVYDITDRESFNKLGMWLDDLHKSTYRTKDLPLVIVGNKQDLEDKRIISYEQAQEYCDSLAIPYFETSARTGYGVSEAFRSVVKRATSIKSAKIEKKKSETLERNRSRQTCPACVIS